MKVTYLIGNGFDVNLGQHRIIAPKNGTQFQTFGKCQCISKNVCQGALNQAVRQGLSARIRFAKANIIFNFAVCFRRPR